MITAHTDTTDLWWRHLKRRLLLLYLLVSAALLVLGVQGQVRLHNEIGHVFGSFFWGIDAQGQVVFVTSMSGQSSCSGVPSSLSANVQIVGVNGNVSQQASVDMSRVYQHARDGQMLTYTLDINGKRCLWSSPATTFDGQAWLQNYGLALLAGCCWLLVGGVLLATAREWTGAVEGLTLLPVAMLFLLYSHWGNVQTAYPADATLQLLWFPAFALLGAAFIHLSLTYRPQTVGVGRAPKITLDLLPYLPFLLIEICIIGLYLVYGNVPTRLEAELTLGYAVFGGVLSLGIGIISLVHIGLRRANAGAAVRRQLGDLLSLWIGGIGLGFCLGVLPVLFSGNPLLPLPIFCLLGAIYPLILLYAVRSLRLIGQLQQSIARTEEAMRQQQSTAEDLQHTNVELQHATSLLLHADMHLRSLLSERIHDQPKQQAQRIRSLASQWQRRLTKEGERDPALHDLIQPVSEALCAIRQISRELERDLRGLQLLVEDAYQRRSLGLKLHLETLVREDLPALHPEESLSIQIDFQALEILSPDLEATPEGEKFAEAVSYTVTQALLNIYNHAEATHASVTTASSNGQLEVIISDDGRGFDKSSVPPEKASMFKAHLKVREAGGTLLIRSTPRPLPRSGTTLILTLPLPGEE